jgi:arginyl-tRNA--protein-N-Asp/Glu arginylyltransferase
MPARMYDAFMDAGFRRAGQMVYQPVCAGCRECIPIRVPVDRFQPDKSQRRCARRNADLFVSVAQPELTDEKLDLYRRYLTQWHAQPGKPAEEIDREALESFLYRSPVKTLEFCYRSADQRLIAVGIADVSPQVLSSVYFYFDPSESARSLGTFGALYELAWARAHGIQHYYLGFWIRNCATMNYKARYKPAELLDTDGMWRDSSGIV